MNATDVEQDLVAHPVHDPGPPPLLGANDWMSVDEFDYHFGHATPLA